MAIFSSKNKHKKGEGSGSNSGQSPPIGANQHGSFSRSGSNGLGGSVGSSSGNQMLMNGAPGGVVGGGSGIPVLSSSQQGYSQQPPQQSTSSSGIPVPSSSSAPSSNPPPSHTVLYPWSQRRISLLPSQLLPPPSAAVNPNHPSSPSQPILGPLSPAPFPRYGHSVNPIASPNGDLYIFGGLVANSVKNDLYLLSCSSPQFGSGPSSNLGVSLVETRGEVPGPRVGHASVGVGNVLIVWGGDTKSRPEERQDDGLYLLNLSTREWTRVKTLGPAPEGRYGHAAAMVGSKFFVFGGQTDEPINPTNPVVGGFKNDLCWFDLQKLKLGQPRWSFVEYAPGAVVPPPRTGHTCVTFGDCLYIFGGTDGQYHYNDTWSYDLNTQIWTELSCIGYIPVPREGHAATLVDDVMYVFGGRGVDGKDLEDLAAFKIGTQRWFMFQNMGPAPSGRSGHAMATWQNKVLVLGGESYTSMRSDDPASVHTLDTTKIKYPPDAARPPQSVSANQPTSPAPAPPNPLNNLPPNPSSPNGSSGLPVSRKSSIPVPQGGSAPTPDELLRQRAASPTGSLSRAGGGGGLKNSVSSLNGGGNPGPQVAAAANSIGQLMTNGSSTLPTAQQSPTQNGLGSSFGYSPSSGGGSKIAKRTTTSGVAPPVRPARPGDEDFGSSSAPFAATDREREREQRKTMDPQSVPGLGLGSPSERAMSPTAGGSRIGGIGGTARKISGGNGVRDRAASPTTNYQSSSSQPPIVQQTPPMTNLNAFASSSSAPQQQQQPHLFSEEPPLSGLAPAVGSLPSTSSPPVQAPADAFYYGSRSQSSPSQPQHPASPQQPSSSQTRYSPSSTTHTVGDLHSSAPTPVDSAVLRKKDQEIERLKSEQGWMVLALQNAKKRGFEVDGNGTEGGDDKLRALGGGVDDEKRELVEMLLALKSELAKTKSQVASQVAGSDEHLQALTRSRTAALQEAAYYRAKLAAFESGSASEVSKLERERAAELEKKLSEALADRHSLESKISKLEQEVDHHSTMKSSVDERHSAAILRAEAAESSHSKALSDLADLQTRSQTHESTIADHLAQLAALTNSSKVLSSERDQYKSRSIEHENAVAQHVRTLEEVQVALSAANVRNEELMSSWEKATSELTQERTKVAQLSQDLETLKIENVATVSKAQELERILKSTKDAHNATQVFASGGLAEILIAHKERSLKNTSRGVDEDGNALDNDDDDDEPSIHVHRLRALEEEMGSVRQLHADTRSKHDSLAAELAEARSRESQLHAQVASLRQEISTLQSQHSTALEELGRHKSLVSEREAEAKEATRTRQATEVKVGILRNLMADHGLAVNDEDLATRYPPMNGNESPEQLYQRVQELESRLDQKTKAHSDLDSTHQDARRELEDLTRQRDQHMEELQRLRENPVADPEDKDRLVQVQGELDSLQQRHSQLEATHLKAVQYVKGTEKMLRRMKEELTRYKERCEELESPERQAELDNLRREADQHRSNHESTSRQLEEHQRSAASLQAEFQRNLRDQQAESAAKIKELNDELSKLDEELEKAQADLEETHAVNASLNKELQTALKNPASPRLGSHAASEDVTRLQADLEQAQNKSEWLKRENASLEERCRTAESKIAILLDHMEGVSEPYEMNGHDSGDHQFGSHQEHDWATTPHGRAGSISDGESEYSARQR
ncbi:uncharacterized protein JCM6883_003890 [Sporobolomyces salmoneus]|uniref:uncharacterized protein n=1 Tax=Sporobolomyces salmoneus TaxID=183962 RepID=UPI003171E52B